MKTPMRVLMIVAHPDDEVIFGFHDLLKNHVTVICMTCGDNVVRKKEFFESMSLTGATGHMLNYPDSNTDTWAIIPIEDFYNKDIKNISKGFAGAKYELVVSHCSDGEYGHKQHIRTHEIAKHAASEMGLPFQNFRDRYRASDFAMSMDKYNKWIAVYKSQGTSIEVLRNFFGKKTTESKNGKVVEGIKPDRTLLTKQIF
jgi:LmbE family N-acetylglucosaminyl deacetylase